LRHICRPMGGVRRSVMVFSPDGSGSMHVFASGHPVLQSSHEGNAAGMPSCDMSQA
jgi:hypothetical protein